MTLKVFIFLSKHLENNNNRLRINSGSIVSLYLLLALFFGLQPTTFVSMMSKEESAFTENFLFLCVTICQIINEFISSACG